MIPTGVEVFVALEPIDMRWSFDRLAGAALEPTWRDQDSQQAARLQRQLLL
jgi:hypothetical protein